MRLYIFIFMMICFVLFTSLGALPVAEISDFRPTEETLDSNINICVLGFRNNTDLSTSEIFDIYINFITIINEAEDYAIIPSRLFYTQAREQNLRVDQLNTEELCSLGAELSIDFILITTLSEIENDLNIEIRIADVSSTNVIGTVRSRLNETTTITNVAETLITRITSFRATQELEARLQREKEEAQRIIQAHIDLQRIERLQAIVSKYGKTYEIGDPGPAGGIIIYINDTVDDWTFIEASPLAAEFQAPRGNLSDIEGLQRSIGDGYANTYLAYAKNIQNNERRQAAQICVELEIGGFKDWYIPNEREIVLIPKGENGLTNNLYWLSDGFYTCVCDGAYGSHSTTAHGCKNEASSLLNNERRVYNTTSLYVRPVRRF